VPPQEPDEKLGSAVSLREAGVASRPSGQPEMRSDDTGASERKQCRMAYNNGRDAREGEADRMEIGEEPRKIRPDLTDQKAVSATKHRDEL